MTPTDLSHPVYHSEDAARAHLEALRWPNGPTCPYCGAAETPRAVDGESMGTGWYYCPECGKKFTVRVGTVYERSHIQLHKWLLGFRLMASSKKGVSAHQLHRSLGITYKTAWFMAHRIREAMKDGAPSPLGGKDKTLEVDETFIGPTTYRKHRRKGLVAVRGHSGKRKILTLVERGGKARSITVENLKWETLWAIIGKHADRQSDLMTDEAFWYKPIGPEFASHQVVRHVAGEYVRGTVTTNTVEGFFSIFKRGMRGVYQHCSEKHLQRYLSEFDFRYNHRAALGVSDTERTDAAIKGAEGKRLTYRNPHKRAA